MTFVIIMMIVMNLTIANSARIDIHNETFIRLKENLDSFEKEVLLVSDLKCYLLNGKDIMEYERAYVKDHGDYYLVSLDNLCLRIRVKDGLIVDLSYE